MEYREANQQDVEILSLLGVSRLFCISMMILAMLSTLPLSIIAMTKSLETVLAEVCQVVWCSLLIVMVISKYSACWSVKTGSVRFFGVPVCAVSRANSFNMLFLIATNHLSVLILLTIVLAACILLHVNLAILISPIIFGLVAFTCWNSLREESIYLFPSNAGDDHIAVSSNKRGIMRVAYRTNVALSAPSNNFGLTESAEEEYVMAIVEEDQKGEQSEE